MSLVKGTVIVVLFITVPVVLYLVLQDSSYLLFFNHSDGQSTPEIHTRTTYPDSLVDPTTNYPVYDTLSNVLSRWNPDNPDPPEQFTETLQHFDYRDPAQRALSEKFRDFEVPFKLIGVPEVEKVVKKWNNDYLRQNMKSFTPHVEESINNHFLYWTPRKKNLRDFVPPTSVVSMTFDDWLPLALKADKTRISSDHHHVYLMVGTSAAIQDSFITHDLDIFSTSTNNYFVTNVEANKGIQCRFSMRGIISENHYDSGKNMIAMAKGAKRYILTPPSACHNLSIISDFNHPSYRHSKNDWSSQRTIHSPAFAAVPAIDTIVRQGEILYIPSYWFHFIVSLEYSIQCNTRSGLPSSLKGKSDIDACLGR